MVRTRASIEALQDLSPDAHDLVSTMIQRNPLSRPTALQFCEHPFFWSDDRRLTFLCDFSDRLEMEGDGSNRVVKLLAVEKGAAQVVGTSWDSSLDDELVSHGQRYRTYDPSSVRDLLRLIRNKHHHFDELPTSLKEAMSAEGCGLLNYFEKRFPNLVTHCFQ
jgi:serine/threonine-protein kinase/endoribonuclease IRE1